MTRRERYALAVWTDGAIAFAALAIIAAGKAVIQFFEWVF